MKIDSAHSQALLGIQRGMNSARDNAARIASAGALHAGGPDDLVGPLVGLKQDRLQVAASVQVLKTLDGLIGALFDDKA